MSRFPGPGYLRVLRSFKVRFSPIIKLCTCSVQTVHPFLFSFICLTRSPFPACYFSKAAPFFICICAQFFVSGSPILFFVSRCFFISLSVYPFAFTLPTAFASIRFSPLPVCRFPVFAYTKKRTVKHGSLKSCINRLYNLTPLLPPAHLQKYVLPRQ